MKYLYLILFVLIGHSMMAQNFMIENSIKCSVFFGNKFKFNISYDINLKSEIGLTKDHAITPFLDLKISFYRNYLGSSVIPLYSSWINGNVALTSGSYYSYLTKIDNPETIQIFSSAFANSLSSSYWNNIGIGTTYIYIFGAGENTYSRYQRVGNVFLSSNNLYFNYLNDGGPLLNLFGDNEDRYFTGGGTLGLNTVINNEKHLFEISFNDFTGFSKDAFEASGLLFIDNIVYKDIKEESYNTSTFSIKYINKTRNTGMSVNFWNPRTDIQDWIHKNISNDPYHYRSEKFYIDYELIYFNKL